MNTNNTPRVFIASLEKKGRKVHATVYEIKENIPRTVLQYSADGSPNGRLPIKWQLGANRGEYSEIYNQLCGANVLPYDGGYYSHSNEDVKIYLV